MKKKNAVTVKTNAQPTDAAQSRLRRQGPAPLALEQRLIFDADVAKSADTLAHADTTATTDASAKTTADTSDRDTATVADRDFTVATETRDTSVADTSTAPREVVFIDTSVTDWSVIASNVKADAIVILIDSSRDGLQQIQNALADFSDLDAIHIVSHGAEGSVTLGNDILSSSNLASRADALAAIGRSLSADGDILLYGCDVGKGLDGVAFLGQLAQATGADVAASTDDTGAAAHGANWTLEKSTGDIGASLFLKDTGVAAYDNWLSAIPLGGKTGWTAVMFGTAQDPQGDSQAKAADTDIVADIYHGSFYIAYDDNGTSTTADDSLAFRLRVDNPSSQTSFGGVAVVGIDGNNDGKYDLFIMVDGRNNGQVIRIMDPGTGANNSPSSTTIAPLPSGWLPNNGVYSFSSSNYSVDAVSQANDPHWNGDVDTGNEGVHDIFVSWRIPMADLIAVMAKASPVDGKTGEYGPRGANGIAFSRTSTVRYTSFTLTQTSSINGDLNGVGPDYDPNSPLPSTEPMTVEDPVSAGPRIVVSTVMGDDIVNDSEDNSTTISGTAKFLNGESLYVTVTDGVTTVTSGNVTISSVDAENGTWTVSGLDLSGLNQGSLTVKAYVTDPDGNVATADGVEGSRVITHDSIAPSISITPVATSGKPVITGTSDLPAGSSLTVTIDPNGDGVLTDLVTYTVIVGSGGNWTLNTATAQTTGGSILSSNLTAYAKITATGADTAGNSASVIGLDKPAVNSSSTQQLQPTVTGTWLRESGDTISVTVNGVTYSDAQITKTDTTWSVTLTNNSGGSALVAGQTYDVVATVTRGATTATDISTGELTITTGPSVDITGGGTASFNTAFPTITGTASSGELVTLRIDPNNDGNFSDAVYYSVLATGGNWSINLASAIPVSGALPAAGLSGTVGLLATVTTTVDPDSNSSTNNSIIATATDTQTVTITVPSISFHSVNGSSTSGGSGLQIDGILNGTEDDATIIYLTGANLLTTDTIAITATDGVHTAVTGTATYDSGTGRWKATLNLSSLNEGTNAITLAASFNSGAATASQTVSHDSQAYAYVESAQATANTPTVTGTADVTAGSLNIKVDRYTKQGGNIQYLDTTNYTTSSGVTYNATTGVWSITVSQSGGTFNNTDEYLVVTVTGTDAAGNNASAVGRVTKIGNSATPITVTIGTIAGDNTIGESEDDSLTISGTTTNAASNYVKVTLTDGTNTFTQTVQASSGNWSVTGINLDTWKDGAIQVVAEVLSAQTGGYVLDSAQATPTHTNNSNVAPVVVITDNKTGVTKDPVTFTFTFSQNVGSTFDISDIVVAGGTAGSLTTVTAGLVYELTVTPTAGVNSGNVTVDVAANKFTAGGLANTAAASGSQAYDTLAPTLAITPLATTGFPVISGTTDLPAGSVLTLTIDPDNLSGSATLVTYQVTVLSGGVWSLNLASSTPTSGSLPASGLTAYAKITAAGTDAAGNSTTVNALVKPVVNSLLTNDTTPTVSGTWTNLSPTDTLYVVVNGVAYSTSASGSSVTLDGVTYATVSSGVVVTNDSWTLTTGTLSAGTYNVTAFAKRTGSETYDTTSGELVIDTTPPAVAITGITTDSGTAADFKTSDQTLVFSGTAEANANVLVVLKDASNNTIFSSTVVATGGTWSIDRTAQTALAEGAYTLTATATDAAGNTALATQAVVIDLTPPSITLTFNAKTADTTPVLHGITDLPAGSFITVQIDIDSNGAFAGGGQYTYTNVVVQSDGTWSVDTGTAVPSGEVAPITPLAQGVVIGVKASGTDTTGLDTTTAVKTLQILAAAPGVSIDALPSGSGDIYADTKVDSLEDDAVVLSGTTVNVADGSTVTVTITDGTTTLQFTTTVTAGVWTLDPANFSALANGTLVVTASVYDSTDDSTYADTYSFIHDKLSGGDVSIDAISQDSGAPGDFVTNDRTLVFSGSGTPSQTVTLELKDSSNAVVFSTTVSTNASGAWTYDYTGSILADGAYTLSATIGGDTATQAVEIDGTAPAGPVTVDTQSTDDLTPAITGTATVQPGETLTVTINGVTYTDGDGHLSLVGTTWTLQIPAEDALTPRSFGYSIHFPTVGFSGVYQVVASIRDVAGNTLVDSTTGELLVADTTAPVVDLDPSDTGTVDHAVTSVGGALVSLDDNGDAATLVEASDSIRTLDITVGGLSDGTDEKIVFGSTTVSATGSSGTQTGITVGGIVVNVTYAGGVFTLQKGDYNNLTAAQAQAILRDIQYQNAAGTVTAGVRTFAITATDDGGNVSDAATASVTVTLPDTTAPAVTAGQSFDYDENQTVAGAVLGTVAATDAVGVTGFRFANGTQTTTDGYFTINDAGEIAITASGIANAATNDFETAPNTFTYGVQARDAAGNWSSAEDVDLNVANLNDNDPVLGDYTVSLAENSSNGTAVQTVSASDADGGSITYSITGGNASGAFTIDANTGVITVADSAELDYETVTQFVLTITASDGTRTDTGTVTVNLTNANDNAITDLDDSNAAANTVAENASNGSTVGVTALATDADSGATVTYSLDNDAGGRFAIDTNTGVVTVLDGSLLDYETDTSHDITIKATSSDGSTQTKVITIAVTNVNDNDPDITSDGGGATAAVSIDENTTAVTTVAATDADGATPTFSITGGADSAKFQINPTTGALEFISAPDYENPTDLGDTAGNNTYVVEVTASDGTRTVTQTITVTVNDVAEGGGDTTPPTIAITGDVASLKAGETATITFTLSEASTDFTLSDITVTGGALTNFTTSDNIVWTATFTPDADSTADGVISVDVTKFSDAASNFNDTGDSLTLSVDTQRPSAASIVLSDTSLKAGETATVTITFNEAVTGFSNADLTVEGGTLSAVSSSDGGVTWTATFTPSTNLEDASNVITLAANSVTDAAGNANSASASSANYTIDTLRPTASIVLSDTALKIGDTATVTITFNEAVSGFSNADLTIEGGTLSAVSSSDGGVTWTATFTPTSNLEDASNVITLASASVSDAAGNTNSGTSSSANYTIDTKAPTLTITDNKTGTVNIAGGDITYTFTFSEPVTGFTSADITVANGTKGAFSGSGTTYTLVVTPSSGFEGNVTVDVAANIAVDAAGNNNTAASQNIQTVDTLRPTASIVLSDTALKIGDTATVTITFSEAVSGFSNADLTVEGGTLSSVSSSDGGVTWTATFTPTSNLEDASNVITLAAASVTDAAGNSNSGTSSSANYTIDTLRPTASIVLSDTALKIGDTATVTITFSEAVSGFSNADLTIEGGTLSSVSSSDGGVTWTATFTPTTNLEDASNVITLASASVSDAAGNSNSGSTASANYTIDTKAPTLTITDNKTGTVNIAGGDITYTFTFSEPVTGFTSADITVANGTKGAFSGSGTTYTLVVTPNSNFEGNVTVDVAANIATDAAGNNNTAASQNSQTVDTLRPTASIVLSDTALKIGDTATVTITFSEAVSGFSNADLAIEGGTLSSVSSSDGGVTWTATFTPTSNLEDASNVITLAAASVTDAAGNSNSGTSSSANYTIDTKAPTASIVLSDSALKIGDTATVTITFSEAVSGFSNADLTVEGGTLSAISSSDGGVTWTATFTPTSNLEDATNAITLASASVTDAAGNANSGTSSSANYTIDTKAPTASISLSDYALKAGETATVTITFSEIVTGFTNSDLTIEGGTLSAVSSSDGGKTYTATFTPTANLEDASNAITLASASVADSAGNANSGSTSSINYSIDTLRPTASIVLSDTALKIGETATVTITFNEIVTGLTVGDFTVEGGSLSGLSSSDGGKTYTATFTPSTNLEDASNVITLSAGAVTDAASNANTATSSSANYAVDTKRPTASIALSDAALKAGETATVTITFSEAVTGFDNSDLTVEGGTLSSVSSSDGGVTWTATFTPSTNLEDASNVISLANSGVSDSAGNVGSGSSSSINYSIDTLRPTASIVLSDSALKIGDTATVTITFNEVVTGLTVGDFTVEGGSLSGLSSSDGGITYTATFTPTSNLEDASNVITLSAGAVTDAASNANTATASSANYAVDTKRPTASIVLSDSALKAGETATVTITFSEAVTGFDSSDLTAANGTLSAVSSSDGGVTWTATFTPTANIEDATNVVSLAANSVQDTAGNSNSTTASSANYAVDTKLPTASIVLSDTALKIGDTATVTITFTEAVTGFDNSDLTVEGGTLSAVSSSDGGVTWTATFTPTSNLEDASNVITLANSGVTDAAGNAGSGSSASGNYVIDTLRPTASIVLSDSALKAGETATVTITFNEVVTGLSTGDFTVEGGALSGLSSSDGGKTYTATFTPTANLEDTTNVITLAASAVLDTAGNSNSATASSANYTIDTLRPSASIVLSDTALKIGDTATVTITFNEAVSGFSNADLTIEGGTLSAVSSSDGGVTWTATFTPTSNLEDASNVISLANSGVTDAAGNAGSGSSTSANYAIDTLRPTASIVLSDTALKVGETATVTITFSEVVTGFTNADLTVEGGSLSFVSSSDGGKTYTATFTPTANIEDASNVITLAANSVQDAAGNANSASASSANYSIDTLRPSASIVLSDSALKIGDTATVTITFNEAVSGFSNADLTIEGGTLSAVSSSDGGITWTATFTPTANLEDASNVITLANSGVSDSAGNAGSGTSSSANYTVDTKRPTAAITLSDTALKAGETSTVTITFSEAVTGFTNADLTIENGTLSAVSSSDGGVTWTATFTPSANLEDASNVISLAANSVQDAAGNSNSASASSVNYSIDTLRPTASIVLSDTALKIGDTATVTITFNEVVTGFTNADLTIEGGTLSAVSSSDGGKTYTATFTPTSNLEDASNVISLAANSVADAAGNANSASASSANYTVDTLRPTATIALSDSALKAGETATVTITFSEIVTGFTNADLTIEGGTLSAVSSSDGGKTYTATFTPTTNLEDTANVITLASASVADAAGNANSGNASSANYTIDTKAPTASIVLSDTALKIGDTATVTITFSEAVTGLTTGDFTVEGGALSGLSSSDGGITYTATFTPSSNLEDASNVISLSASSAQDAAGNDNTASSSGNYAIDTVRPTASIVLSDTALKAGETSTVTITFSEAVTGFSNSDLTIEGGTLSAVSSSDGGVTWTATFTPTANIEDTTNVISLAANSVADAAGNVNSATASSSNYTIDTLRPTATITLSDTALKIGETSTVTITFSEAVTGLATGDFTVEGGSLSGLSSSDGGITYTATFTPTANLEDASNVITLAANSVQDAAGNTNAAAASSAGYAIDTLRPDAPTVTPLSTKDTTPTVTGSFDSADSTMVSVVINGVTYTPGDGHLSVSGDTWTLTIPAGSALADGDYEVAVTVTDSAGNQSTDTSSTELHIDHTAPSLDITTGTFNYTNSHDVLVTFTFDEPVAGFDASDVTVVGGTLGNFTQVDDHTWTAVFTATTGNGIYSVTVADDTYTDLATNNGSGDSTAIIDVSIKTVSFVDSFVGGIEFSTSSGLSGLSDADGDFSYRDGDTITFKIGNITLGVFDSTTIQGDYLFIQDIVGVGLNDLNSMYVENMAILLQLLDEDADAANGITISQLIRDAAATIDPFDLSLSDKQELSDALDELRLLAAFIPLFSADTELSPDGQNVFETQAMAHVKATIEALAGTRAPVAFDARTPDTIDVNAAVITYNFTAGVITFSDADLLANSHGQQVRTENLIVKNVALSAGYADIGVLVDNGDGTYTITLAEGVTPYDIENLSLDYTVQDWTVETSTTSSGLDTNKSHLSWTLDTPLDANGNVPEDVGYIQLTVKSALTFAEDKELTFSFTSERLSNETVQYAEFGDDFLIPFEYSNDGGATWQLMSAFKITLAAGNDTLLVRVPIFDDASQERALELFDGTIKGDAFYDEKVQFNIADNDGPSEVPLMRIDFVYSVENQGVVTYTVRLDRASDQVVTVDYNTQDFGAVAGVDYEATSGTLVFQPGETEKTITVTLNDDLTPEQLEFAIMNLRNATNAAIADMQGSLRIFDNDIEPRSATVSAPVVVESASNLVFTITLDQAFTSAALLDVGIETTMADDTYGPYEYSLNGGQTWDFFNPVANPGSTTAGHLIVQPGVTQILVRVSVNDPDTIPEADDTFKFTVSGNYAITDTAEAVALLRNDDGSAVTIDPVTPDNILSFAESGLPTTTVTGSVVGDAHEGDTVTIVVNGVTYTGTLDADLAFSIDVATSDLLADPTIDASFTSTGPDDVERTFTAERTVALDLEATRPTVDPYYGNDTTPVITGSADLQEGETLTVTVNGVTYTQGDGHLSVSDGRWTLVIPPENALAEGRYNVVATVTDAVGNTASDSSADELTVIVTEPATPRPQPFDVVIPDPFGGTSLPGDAPDWVPPVFTQERSFSFGFSREDYQFLGLGRDYVQDIAITQRGFKIIVIPADIPNLLLYRGVPDSYVESDNPFSFTIPVDAFVHTQADAQVVLNATLTDGSALPDWLHFDRVTGTFEGIPPKGFTGELRVKVTARDSMGLQSEAIFRLFIGVKKESAALPSRTGLSAQFRDSHYLPTSSGRAELASR